MNQSTLVPQNNELVSARVSAYLSKVYLWMAFGLLTTALVAGYTAKSDALMTWLTQGINIYLVLGANIIVFLAMMFMAAKLSANALRGLFLTYAAVTGLTFGPLLLVYTSQSLGLAFGCTAGTFGAMSIYGAVTKRDLSGIGRFAIMMLLGLIVTSIINIFMGSSMLNFLISLAGVAIFSALTAYDTQKLIEQGRVLEEGEMDKPAIMGAAILYLDFINLFLYMLRFLGNSRD